MVADEFRIGNALAVIEPKVANPAHPEVFPHAELLSVGDITIGIMDASNPPESQWPETDEATYWDELSSAPDVEQVEVASTERQGVVRRIASMFSLSRTNIKEAEDARETESINVADEVEHITPIVLSGNVVINGEVSRRQVLAGKFGNIFSRKNRITTSSIVPVDNSAQVPEVLGMSRRRFVGGTAVVAASAILAAYVGGDSFGLISKQSGQRVTVHANANGHTAETVLAEVKDEMYSPAEQAHMAEKVRTPAGDWVKSNVPTVLTWENQVVDILSKYKTIHGVPIANIDSGLVLSFMTVFSGGNQWAKNPNGTQTGLLQVPDDIGKMYFENYQGLNSEHSIKAFIAEFSLLLDAASRTGKFPDRISLIKAVITGYDTDSGKVAGLIPDKDGAAKLGDIVPLFDNQWSNANSPAFDKWSADKYVKQFLDNAKNEQKDSGQLGAKK